MQNDVIIEQMQLSERNAVLSFLQTAYLENPRQSEPAFWDWHFRQPPRCQDGNLPVWLAKSGDRIAGQLAAIPVELNVGGETRPAIWILDLIVDPDFRRMGIAQKLVLAAERLCPYILGVNTNEQHAPALLQKQGFVIVSKIQRLHKLLFPCEAFREIAKLGPMRSIANLAFKPFRTGLRKKTNVRHVTEFDASFDKLWSRANKQWPCSVSRTGEMLNWQFRRQPNKKYEVIGYFENDKLLGYAVLFFRKRNEHGRRKGGDQRYLLRQRQGMAQTMDDLMDIAEEKKHSKFWVKKMCSVKSIPFDDVKFKLWLQGVRHENN